MTKLQKLRAEAREIFLCGVQGADPAAAVRATLQMRHDRLRVGDRVYDLAGYRNVYLLGCGKAAVPMARGALEFVGDRVGEGFLVVAPGLKRPVGKLEVVEAGHPIPDAGGLRAADRVIDLARRCEREDLFLFLLSGGASALLPSPVAGVSLADKQSATGALLKSGATIHEINAIRKHLSRLKGGRLAHLAAPAQLICLILSDVLDDAVASVGSGPTASDPTTFADCLQIIARYGLERAMPAAVLALLSRGAQGGIPETLKSSNPVFDKVQNVVVGSNRLARAGAQSRAEALGYRSTILTERMQGESRRVAKAHVEAVKKAIAEEGRPVCLISGGETTVTVCGDGIGGRNQEFALAAAVEIENLDGVVILSGGTDGRDGPTDAAGGIVDGSTIRRGKAAGLDPAAYLARNDSYNFLRAVDGLLITGPTSTNVMDLQITLLG